MMKQISLICIILLLNKGSTSNECDNCLCCKNKACYQHYQSYSNYCIYGCINGYFGDQCINECIENCLTCTDPTACNKCSDGYYGNICRRCPINCLKCSNSSECESCKNGFYSGKNFDIDYLDNYNDCRHRCNQNCITCTSYYSCNSCKEGFYNGKQGPYSVYEYNDCRLQCNQNCKSCSSYHTCEECKRGFYSKGYWSNNVWYTNCNNRCVSPCKSCTALYKCTECIDGYYNYNQYCYICKNTCRSCTSLNNCNVCIAGRYNSQFSDCRELCKPGCKVCSTYDSCTDCVSGWYGTSCQNRCGRGCLDGQCNIINGHCTCKNGFVSDKCETCVNDRYGTNCDVPCAPGCQYNICNDSGKCTFSCKIGFAGDKCDKCEKGRYGISCKHCPNGCKNNDCSFDGKCYACKPGKYGNYCAQSCSVGCGYDNCTENGECSSCKAGFTDIKCDRCIAGKFGNLCDQNCPLTCLACNSLTNCTTCLKNHWGSTCQPCPKNCLSCSSNSTCSLCDIGFQGRICKEECNKNCLNHLCDKLTGNCSHGCVTGFYGNLCDMKCSPNCLNNICGRVYGDCSQGCKSGYNGTRCTQALKLLKEEDNNMSVVIGASIGGGLFVMFIILLIAVVLLMSKRRRVKNQDVLNKEIKQENENVTYSEINDTHMTAENNHTDDNETDRENITNSEINDANLLTKSQETDNIYAKPIKPKRKTEAIKSLNRNSNEVTVNNPTYEKPDTSQTETVKTNRTSKPPIATKPAQKYDNNVITKPSAMQPTSHISHIENDAVLEIEEDIDCLSSRFKSVFIEEQKTTELDHVDTYYNVAAVIKRKITLDKLPDFVAKKTKKGFVDEFQALPAMLIKPYVDSQKRENRSKNRYKGIYPYDDTRVVLKEGDSDYINASYIDGYNKNKAYTASIGPTYKYMGDMSAFWIMVWQEIVGKIVMLTNLEEGGVPKCDQYWPEKDFSLMFANIQVTCHTEENYADYTFRSFSVQKDSIKREIVQVHFTAWPDKGTPDDVTSLIEFRQKVNSTKTKLDGPILVHCSAGIGRTGTYIALDSITNEGETEGAVDIYAFVRNMREQRVNMIQTAEQYQYLHNALVHTLTFDSKAVEASLFNEYMKTHTEDHLGNMFEKLQASVEQRTDDEQEAVKRNKALVNKNRNGADIPGDRNRPRLFMAKTPGQSDYINAVYVNSFKNVNRFLISQTPLPDTVEDFLTLIVQENVSCVISMETLSSANKDVGAYCPADNQTLKKGAFTIKTERGDGTDQYQLKKMKISYKSKSGSEEVIVPHVQYTQWNNNKSIPGEPVKFVQFVKDMELKFSRTDTNRPMLVHCLTGAKKAGLFCVVSTLLEKTQIDQEVSVANTVRQIKYRRHLAVPDKDQYIFCHHCVNEYLRTFDIYSNFELKT